MFLGATTIFIDDDPFALFETSVRDTISPSVTESINQNTEIIETTTDNGVSITTEDESDETTTTAPLRTTTQITDHDDSDENDDGDDNNETTTTHEELHEKPQCEEGSVLHPSTVYRTLTFLTTYFIPDEENDSETSTSIESNEVIQTDVLLECSRQTQKAEVIKATSVQTAESSTIMPEKSAAVKISVRNKLLSRPRETTQAQLSLITTTEAEQPTSTETSDEIEQQIDDEADDSNPTTEENSEGNTVEAITSSVSTSSTTEANKKTDEDDDIESNDIIYKTLFTTYT